MRFMLLQNYGGVEADCLPMSEWTPGDIKAHVDFQRALNEELTELGELVDAQGLAGPDQASSWSPTASQRQWSPTAPIRSPRSCWPATG